MAVVGVSILSLCWVGCLVVTVVLGKEYRDHEDGMERALRGLSAGLSGFEAIIMAAIAVKDFCLIIRWGEKRRERESEGNVDIGLQDRIGEHNV